jgi:hypothetical protein
MWTINDGNSLKCADCGRHEPEHTAACPHATVETSPVLKFQHALTESVRLKTLYGNRMIQLLDTKGVKWEYDLDDIIIYEVTEEGFQLKTSYHLHDDYETDYTFFPWSDLDVNVTELNRRVEERKAKEQAEREARDRAFKARQQAIADERDKKEYVRLKQKFGDA